MRSLWDSKEYKDKISNSAKKSYKNGRKVIKYWLGKKFSEETKVKLSLLRRGNNMGVRNGMWKGDKVGYKPLHKWVRRNKEMAKFCEKCGQSKKLEIANISQKYKRDLSDWEWLCRKCHMLSDGRLEKLLNGRKSGSLRGV